MKPVEGTIWRFLVEQLSGPRKRSRITNDAVEVMRAAWRIEHSCSGAPTPGLEEVGVVDSGEIQGLVFIYERILVDWQVNSSLLKSSSSTCNHVRNDQCRTPQVSRWVMSQLKTSSLATVQKSWSLWARSTYVKDFDYDEFRNYWTTLGFLWWWMTMRLSDSSIQKIQMLVMQEGLKYGSLVKVKVDNMRNQHEAQVEKKTSSQTSWRKECHHRGSCWWELADIFKSAKELITSLSGQTMNPSTRRLCQKQLKSWMRAISFILPNSKNILILRSICSRSDWSTSGSC